MSSSLKKISGIEFTATTIIVTPPPTPQDSAGNQQSQSPDPGQTSSSPSSSSSCQSPQTVQYGPNAGMQLNSALHLLYGLGGYGEAHGSGLNEFGGYGGGFWANSSSESSNYSGGGGGASTSASSASSSTSASQQAAANQQSSTTTTSSTTTSSTTSQWSTGSATTSSTTTSGTTASSGVTVLASSRPTTVGTLNSILSILTSEYGYSPAEVSYANRSLSSAALVATHALVGEPILLIEYYSGNHGPHRDGSYPEDVVGIGVVSVDFIFRRAASITASLLRLVFERTTRNEGRIFDLLCDAHDAWISWYNNAKAVPEIIITDIYTPGSILVVSYIKEIPGRPGENNFTAQGTSAWFKAYPVSFSQLNSPAYISLLSNLPSYVTTEAAKFTPQV